MSEPAPTVQDPHPFSLPFSFRGRIGRVKYIVGIVIAVFVLLATVGFAASAMNSTGGGGAAILAIPLVPLFFWIHAAVTIKRLRDANAANVLYPVFVLGPVVWIVATAESIESHGFFAAAGLVILLAFPAVMPPNPAVSP